MKEFLQRVIPVVIMLVVMAASVILRALREEAERARRAAEQKRRPEPPQNLQDLLRRLAHKAPARPPAQERKPPSVSVRVPGGEVKKPFPSVPARHEGAAAAAAASVSRSAASVVAGPVAKRARRRRPRTRRPAEEAVRIQASKGVPGRSPLPSERLARVLGRRPLWQQAVVLSELLGPPVGISDPQDRHLPWRVL